MSATSKDWFSEITDVQDGPPSPPECEPPAGLDLAPAEDYLCAGGLIWGPSGSETAAGGGYPVVGWPGAGLVVVALGVVAANRSSAARTASRPA
jgi:hypothetical protein